MTLTGFDRDTSINDKLLKIVPLFLIEIKKRHAPVHGNQWGAILGLSLKDTDVRTIVSHLRSLGDPEQSRIASSDEGYWWARSFDELGPTLAHLSERRNRINQVIAGIRRAFGEPETQESLF